MTDIRAFIAISLHPEITRGLDNVLSDLKRRIPGTAVRWVPARNIHLTVKFLGDVPAARLEAVTKALQDEAQRHPTFELQVGGFGCFPSSKRPRVVWIGVEAPTALGALQQAVEAEMARLGYEREERPFSPHLTLGRVGQNIGTDDQRRLAEILANFKVGLLGKFQVESVAVYKSDLQPSGAVYTRLFSAALQPV
jgi:RNA 2',3'-cyclic 3'-phosphodiesterase